MTFPRTGLSDYILDREPYDSSRMGSSHLAGRFPHYPSAGGSTATFPHNGRDSPSLPNDHESKPDPE